MTPSEIAYALYLAFQRDAVLTEPLPNGVGLVSGDLDSVRVIVGLQEFQIMVTEIDRDDQGGQ